MPAPINPSLRVLGPCWIKTRNKAFYALSNVTLVEKLTTFEVTLSNGTKELREDVLTMELHIPPVGKLDALSVLWPYGSCKPGDLVHAAAEITAVNAGTNVATLTSLTRFRTGAPVRPGSTLNDPPAGLTAGTIAYLKKASSTTATFHPTEADALAGTNTIDLTDAGTGRNTIIEEEYLILQPFDGSAPYRFFNTAVITSPAMNLGANKTAIGETVIECYRQFATLATDAAAFYDRPGAPIVDTSFAFSDIKTESFSLAWGAALPWSSMSTREAIGVSFPLSLNPWGGDANGVASRVITDLGAQVTATPIGFTADDLLAKRVLQGAGAGRGRRIVSADNLDIESTTADLLFVRLNGAIMTDPGALNWDSIIERTGQMAWAAQRVVTAGVAGDLYSVGASEPA